MLVPGDDPTWSVSGLHDVVNGLLGHAFPDEIWVEGELCNYKRSANGHAYFHLVDADQAGSHQQAQLAVTLFARERAAVNRFLTERGGSIKMGDGVRVRIRGRLALYPARSSLQLRMTWIDPDHTLGVMGRERDRLLAALAADGSLARNGRTTVPRLPLRVALVTSVGSAAHADALDELASSGLGFRVTVVDARTQGPQAAPMIAAAIRAACAADVDVVLLVRGGGARTDLLAFDDEVVARSIASADRPVFTGIGHEVDRTVADEVAHSAHKTPTAAAAAVIAEVRLAAAELHDLRVQIDAATRGRLVRAGTNLERLSSRAGRAAQRHLDRNAQHLEHLRGRVGTAVRHRLDVVASTVDSAAGRIRAQHPDVLLSRGWTITRDEHGRVLSMVDPPSRGALIVTTMAGGTIVATVDDVTPDPVSETQNNSIEEPT